MDQKDLLINRLREYGKTWMYPFHMPGHKRLKREGEKLQEDFEFPNPFTVDITEIEGFDNLHHPEGMLRESMDWAARVYGSDRTWYLVNGSTGGILSSISACCRPGGKILMARNCHKSAYHGACLNRLKVSYLYPQFVAELGIQGGILPEDVENALREEPDIQAVMVVSPTYDGIVSDIGRIAEIVHRRGIPLIVDEAHGAHFPFAGEFPVSALSLGADLVIQSVHKTLPCLTQTALLHFKKNEEAGGPFADMGRLEHYLQIYQSSSPSYVLMASIENGIFQMERERCGRGREGNRLDVYFQNLGKLRERLKEMKYLRLGGTELKGGRGIFDVDCSKILVSARGTGTTGSELGDFLRRKHGLEMELCGADYVLGITSCFDSEEGLLRLGDGVLEADRWLEAGGFVEAQGGCVGSGGVEARGRCGGFGEAEVQAREFAPSSWGGVQPDFSLPKARIRLSPGEAMDAVCRKVPLRSSEGMISGEFVYVYPPGIPILAPGEEVPGEVLSMILEYIGRGLPVQGPEDHSLEFLKVIDKG